jgi:predicted transcriptional regulator of viral defense system
MTKDKIGILIQQPQKLFHTSDLKVLWNISNQNTLYKTITRLIKKKVLISVQKGFYSVIPLNQLDPIEIGFRAINHFSYLSTESVLSKNGIINQSPTKITFVSSSPANFNINEVSYLVRQLKPQCLNNSVGIIQNDKGVFVATTERAIADMLYFQPNYHFDANSIINWDLVKSYQQQINYL